MREIQPFLFLANLAITVSVGVFALIIPNLTRKSFLFGVKIPQEQRDKPEAKRLVQRYIKICIAFVSGMLVLESVQYLLAPELSMVAMLYYPLLFIPLQLVAFVPNWRAARQLKESQGWQTSESAFAETESSYSRGTLAALPKAWYAASLAVSVVCVAISLLAYPQLPDRIPTNLDFNMQPNAWVDKSLPSVLALPLMNVALTLVFLLVGVMFVKARLQIDPQHPELSFAQHRLYRRLIGHGFGYMSFAMATGLALLFYAMAFGWYNNTFWLIVALLFSPVVVIVAVIIRAGQGGGKLMPAIATAEAPAASARVPAASLPARSDDQYWLFGLFYFNRNDPAYILEDRFGANIGFNYARRPVQLGVAVSLVLLVAIYIWMTVMLLALI
ncbi:MAG: DUF1648 domain-containing protein [Coriobacteriia bacterium]|nr:DUF1648 domain-containing protein [Coriobacteriia bacterium]